MSLSLSKRTHDVLANFSAVNPSIQFREGNELKTMSVSRDVMAIATVVEVFPKEFAIYDISRFLGAVSLFENPSIKFEDKYLTIEAENRKINYVYASPKMIIAPKKEDNVADIPVISSFELTSTVLTEVTKVLALLKLNEVYFIANGSKIRIEVKEAKAKGSSDSYVTNVGPTDKEFTVVLKGDKIQKLLNDNYKVSICYDEGAGLAVFESKDVKYYITMEQGSSFNG